MNRKQKTALMTAAMLSVNFVGCSGIGRKTKEVEVSMENSYSSEQLKIEGLQEIYDFYSMGEKMLLGGMNSEYEPVYYLYNMTSGETKEVKLQYLDKFKDKENTSAYVSFITTDADGSVNIVYDAYDWSDDNYTNLGYTIETYDSEMQLKETREGLQLFDNGYVQQVVVGKDGSIFATFSTEDGSSTIEALDKDFKSVGTVEINGSIQFIDNIIALSNGDFFVSYYNMEGMHKSGTFNSETKKLENVEVAGIPQYFNRCFAGNSEYDMFVSDSTAVYGIKMADKTAEEVVNWVNSDFMGDFVQQVVALNDGRFMITSYDTDYTNSEMYILKERDAKEMKNIKFLTLATLYSNQNLQIAINQYNRTHTNSRIAISDYSKYQDDENPDAAMEKFKNDMTSGVVADLICLDSLPFESLASKGILEDMNSLMEKDGDFSKDAYFENYFKAIEHNGKLQRMGFGFYIRTLMAKEKYVGKESGMSLEQFMEFVKNPPSGMTAFDNMARGDAMYWLLTENMNSFIDINNATCDFNNEKFISMLEYCNSLPEQTVDYGNMSDSDWDKYWAERDNVFRKDKALFKSVYISDLREYHNDIAGSFNNEPVTLIGTPTLREDSNGGKFETDFTIGISAGSKNKEMAWEFVKFMLSEEFQISQRWAFPVNRNAFDHKLEESMLPDTYQGENGQIMTQPNYWGSSGEPIDIGYPTKEEADAIRSYVNGITECGFYDTSVNEIIQEEVEKLYAGDQSAADAAKMIQSRASLYLSESH